MRQFKYTDSPNLLDGLKFSKKLFSFVINFFFFKGFFQIFLLFLISYENYEY